VCWWSYNNTKELNKCYIIFKWLSAAGKLVPVCLPRRSTVCHMFFRRWRIMNMYGHWITLCFPLSEWDHSCDARENLQLRPEDNQASDVCFHDTGWGATLTEIRLGGGHHILGCAISSLRLTKNWCISQIPGHWFNKNVLRLVEKSPSLFFF
jgi:hypothetical protein